jgi:hypothetical protein
MRGVCWEAGRRIEPQQLEPLRALGTNWISQTPFGWCRGLDSPEVRLATTRVFWGESDSGIVQTAVWARERGMRTLLKPHLWVRHAQWSGDVVMHTEADWEQWFAAYTDFILHYARLAEAQHLDALAVGTELAGTTGRSEDWRRVIAAVRREYRGPITYCANWNAEVEAIDFWDALDFIGVQAYYPLGTAERPSLEAIRAAWQTPRQSLARLARGTGRQVVFTEVGYRSAAGALRQPWVWQTDGAQDLALQRDAYRALFEMFWDEPWFGGTFIWKWHPDFRPGMDEVACDFTPQGKPAERVMHDFYADKLGADAP